jgi:hypothetical protein
MFSFAIVPVLGGELGQYAAVRYLSPGGDFGIVLRRWYTPSYNMPLFSMELDRWPVYGPVEGGEQCD